MTTIDIIDGKRLIKMIWHDAEFGALLPQSFLLDHGWTKAMIRDRLGEPDCFGLNPKGGAYVRLYSQHRVRMTKLRVIR